MYDSSNILVLSLWGLSSAWRPLSRRRRDVFRRRTPMRHLDGRSEATDERSYKCRMLKYEVLSLYIVYLCSYSLWTSWSRVCEVSRKSPRDL